MPIVRPANRQVTIVTEAGVGAGKIITRGFIPPALATFRVIKPWCRDDLHNRSEMSYVAHELLKQRTMDAVGIQLEGVNISVGGERNWIVESSKKENSKVQQGELDHRPLVDRYLEVDCYIGVNLLSRLKAYVIVGLINGIRDVDACKQREPESSEPVVDSSPFK